MRALPPIDGRLPRRRPPALAGRLTVALAVLVAVSVGVAGQRADAPAQPFYKAWTMADLLPSVVDLGVGHDWTQGRDLFRLAACGVCHALGAESEGSGLAPDLTSVGATYTRDFVLQSILEPSAEINGRYFHTTFTLTDGRVITGSIVDIVDKTIFVAPVMLSPEATVEIAEAGVKSEAPSPISPMPAGLLNAFTKEQIVELLAFLDAGGDRNAAVYRKK
jgi:putative heme-binding domain-containing protein